MDKFLASHNATNQFQIIPRTEMGSCTRMAKEWYCSLTEVALSGDTEHCLVALKGSRWKTVKRACVWQARTAGTAIWRLDSSNFAVFTPNETTWAVQCLGKVTTHQNNLNPGLPTGLGDGGMFHGI